MNKENFWKEVFRRRNHVYYIFIGWLVIGPVLMGVYQNVFQIKNLNISGWLTIVTWGLFVRYSVKRLLVMECYSCNKPAIKNAFFFKKDAKCQYCGANPFNDDIEYNHAVKAKQPWE